MVPLTWDAKPSVPEEQKRIAMSGQWQLRRGSKGKGEAPGGAMEGARHAGGWAVPRSRLPVACLPPLRPRLRRRAARLPPPLLTHPQGEW